MHTPLNPLEPTDLIQSLSGHNHYLVFSHVGHSHPDARYLHKPALTMAEIFNRLVMMANADVVVLAHREDAALVNQVGNAEALRWCLWASGVNAPLANTGHGAQGRTDFLCSPKHGHPRDPHRLHHGRLDRRPAQATVRGGRGNGAHNCPAVFLP